MDRKSLEMLDFPQVREILAGFTAFSASRTLALALEPFTDYEQASLRLRQSAEARRLLELEPSFTIGGVTDIRETVEMAARGRVLEPPELLEVQQTLTSIGYLKRGLSRFAREVPLLWEIGEGLVELPKLEKDIASRISMNGELLDSASPQLALLRQQLRSVREQLLDRLESIINSPRGHRIVQDPIITEREGRYVIPVKMGSQKEIRGIVHDVSSTGASVFVEPMVTVEMGNNLREVATEEKREVERILRQLSHDIGLHVEEISASIAAAAELDLAMAKARYAQKAGAAEPALVNFAKDGGMSTGVLKLVDAQHPLLGDKAVPLSVEIGRDYSILIITGPNTGGKTVALKTIGLLSLMAQSGIPIPAASESQIPFFDGVFSDIGDEQSIAQTLSTFSWHIGNIIRILGDATRKSLVLLDELGTSTDPTEGSALARALLLQFLSLGTMAVITTHFTELKAFAHNTTGLQNASLDFDPVTLAPTYHLTVGIPGGSNALATAARLGLSPEIIREAESMLSQGTQQLEGLLGDLMSEKQQLQSLRHELEKERDELEQRDAALQKELERLRTEERKALQEARDDIVREAAELHREIRGAAAELRREKTKERIEQTRKSLASVQERLQSGVWQTKSAEAGESASESRIRVGDTVQIKDSVLQGKVLTLFEETQQVEVQAGQTRIKLGLENVEKVSPSGSVLPSVTPVRKPSPGRAVSRQLDLRGKRADEIESLLDSYLNDTSLSSLGEVRIIHGIGTGVVRQIVREMLSHHPLVKSFRPGGRSEGGDGATVVTL